MRICDAIFVLSFLPVMLLSTIMLSGGLTDWKHLVDTNWRFSVFMALGFGYCGLYGIVRLLFRR